MIWLPFLDYFRPLTFMLVIRVVFWYVHLEENRRYSEPSIE